MNDFKKYLSEEERLTYLQGLLYILGKEKKLNAEKTEYMQRQAEDAGITTEQLKGIKAPKKPKDLIKLLKAVNDIRIKRYIIREMIMLAVADHEISDEEMVDIYTIGAEIGIKEDKINDFFLWAAEGIEWQMKGVSLIKDDL